MCVCVVVVLVVITINSSSSSFSFPFLFLILLFLSSSVSPVLPDDSDQRADDEADDEDEPRLRRLTDDDIDCPCGLTTPTTDINDASDYTTHSRTLVTTDKTSKAT